MRRAAIVAAVRTPIGTFGGSLRPLSAADLATAVVRAVVQRSGVDPDQIEDVVFAQSYANSEAPCIGRWAALNAGLPVDVPGLQIDRRCGGGLQAVVTAAMMVQSGAADVVITCGVESMSKLGLGPVPAVRKLFKRTGLTFDDMARVEINEAFAVQVLAVLKAWDWSEDDKVNVCGSGISLGHPIGATGMRILTTMLHELCRRTGGLGLETMCIGGGQGLAQLSRRPRPCAIALGGQFYRDRPLAAIQHVATYGG